MKITKGLVAERLVTAIAAKCGFQINNIPLNTLEVAASTWYQVKDVISYANARRHDDAEEIKYNAKTLLDHLYKLDLIISSGSQHIGLQLTTHSCNHDYYWERVKKVKRMHRLQNKAGIYYSEVLSISLNDDYGVYNDLSNTQLAVLQERFYNVIGLICAKAEGEYTKPIYFDARLKEQKIYRY